MRSRNTPRCSSGLAAAVSEIKALRSYLIDLHNAAQQIDPVFDPRQGVLSRRRRRTGENRQRFLGADGCAGAGVWPAGGLRVQAQAFPAAQVEPLGQRRHSIWHASRRLRPNSARPHCRRRDRRGGADGVRNCLVSVGMLDEPMRPVNVPQMPSATALRRENHPRAPLTGLMRHRVTR